MNITWLGHACFLLEQDGYRVVTDPYTRVPGYPPLSVEANALYCSHEHFDHAYREGYPPTGGKRVLYGRRSGCVPRYGAGARRGRSSFESSLQAASGFVIWAIWGTSSRPSRLRPSGSATCC